jgi:prophage antirepressor-like protein
MDENLSVPKNNPSQELTGLEKVAFFQDKKIRKIWQEEEWWFSVVDIVGALTDSIDAKDYWYRLKIREKDSTGIELSTFCRQLKLESTDGKKYETDCVNTESAFRIIQSIPSKKAEPFKLWLAKVGKERIDETYDPELTINRAMHAYLQKGYSKEWINQRLKTIEVRKELTDEWNRTGIEKQSDYAILTNELTKAWAGKTVKEYKEFKNLKKESLRDNMSNLELVLNMLAEATTTEISKSEDPKTFVHSKKIAKDGGTIAGKTRKNIEKKIGKSVIRKENYLELKEKKQLK